MQNINFWHNTNYQTYDELINYINEHSDIDKQVISDVLSLFEEFSMNQLREGKGIKMLNKTKITHHQIMKGKKINKLIDFRIGQIKDKELFTPELLEEIQNRLD